ncbi:MAG: hypothetical protein O9327_01975 [Polaromonas sp.]|nr:hypothetical protein [Polaromonas sp.]
MNTAFQISADDVANVLASNPRTEAHEATSIESQADELLARLDLDEVESAALYGDTLEEQTDYAHDEIARQLRVMAVLKPLA